MSVFVCPFCGCSFDYLSYLERHQIVHLPLDHPKRLARINYCTYNGCEFSTDQKSNLKVHITAVHTKEKPYKCDECGNTYGDPSSRTRHKKAVHGYVSTRAPRIKTLAVGTVEKAAGRAKKKREARKYAPYRQEEPIAGPSRLPQNMPSRSSGTAPFHAPSPRLIHPFVPFLPEMELPPASTASTLPAHYRNTINTPRFVRQHQAEGVNNLTEGSPIPLAREPRTGEARSSPFSALSQPGRPPATYPLSHLGAYSAFISRGASYAQYTPYIPAPLRPRALAEVPIDPSPLTSEPGVPLLPSPRTDYGMKAPPLVQIAGQGLELEHDFGNHTQQIEPDWTLRGHYSYISDDEGAEAKAIEENAELGGLAGGMSPIASSEAVDFDALSDLCDEEDGDLINLPPLPPRTPTPGLSVYDDDASDGSGLEYWPRSP